MIHSKAFNIWYIYPIVVDKTGVYWYNGGV